MLHVDTARENDATVIPSLVVRISGARIELVKIQDDGSAKKIDGRLTNETGSFVFRLSPEPARYRVTVKPNGAEPVSKEVEVDGAAVYRVALSLPPAPK